LVLFSPSPPNDLSFVAMSWRDCSVQLPHAKLDCFTAALLLGLVVRRDGKINAPVCLNLHLL